ncbi:winged helix-turn-helix domain-containing protein [Streptomyces sp. FZ201]|uniref:ArsR/SmtB family transcription factor n=1 Tax=Streptomyces sp. FZ201 TaxID=3057122 RepID=UPI0021BF263D|nr:winged helix-turn-helix domain-containing protein [Streptomyces sp. FZ201]
MEAELVWPGGDPAGLRFAVSPLWEVATSFRLLSAGLAHAVHRPWMEQVRPRVTAAGLDRERLAELVPCDGYVPDFLNPAPAGPTPTLAEELAVLRQVPAERVRRDLVRLEREQGLSLGPRLRALYDDPEAQLPKVAEEIETYWQLALAPYWARVRAVLDADVMHRARQLAEHGTAYLLNDLHSLERWEGPTLRLRQRGRGPRPRAELVLVPSVFAGPGLFTRVSPPDPPQLAYPARGTAGLWRPRPVPAADALAAVLGRSRTRLLTELDIPAATTDLARRTGLSPATVSQSLTALRDAGLVSAHRTGRWVLYARTAAADALLASRTPEATEPHPGRPEPTASV